VVAAAVLTLLLMLPQMGSEEMQAAYEYLFTPQQRQAFDRLGSAQRKESFLADFWKKHDPSPETDYNELKELFLRRLESANLYYDLELDRGWRSDRGKVLIFFGYPNEIRRSRFAPYDDKKYEIWIYGEITGGNKVELVFEDEFDSGDFVLTTPVVFPEMISLGSELPVLAEEGQHKEEQ
jgi:GWxTD domain-containing protein